MKPLHIARCLGISAAALVLALSVTSPAGATPMLSAPQATDPCGNHTHQILDQQYRYWRNCITTSEKINIDKIFWPDEKICVKAGSDTGLGWTTDVRGASRVGDC
ncbi:hypothetical protein PUR34_00760 [Streptomyces sp. JV185]|uniref:hypothetical protein n=1 Tax=Streptomyces sp. JV185 TaxID=858638 RepID=UPI002E7A56D8|nr:hypothetical protein [Streptomyces sp. JV185]MEE1766795.1 hypothetical protein [Streptomyces sp. JV185]